MFRKNYQVKDIKLKQENERQNYLVISDKIFMSGGHNRSRWNRDSGKKLDTAAPFERIAICHRYRHEWYAIIIAPSKRVGRANDADLRDILRWTRLSVLGI